MSLAGHLHFGTFEPITDGTVANATVWSFQTVYILFSSPTVDNKPHWDLKVSPVAAAAIQKCRRGWILAEGLGGWRTAPACW